MDFYKWEEILRTVNVESNVIEKIKDEFFKRTLIYISREGKGKVQYKSPI
ncbi:hypothetical protein HET73_04240 [Wolbachia endosymbiont of Atemnus politus]|nr:hypothetical protein [Wolbachia endosymbiont of Atemnus politus]NSM56655.1 hypothetical protein [Wolbachia endosymbiont of Atemnus politus]